MKDKTKGKENVSSRVLRPRKAVVANSAPTVTSAGVQNVENCLSKKAKQTGTTSTSRNEQKPTSDLNKNVLQESNIAKPLNFTGGNPIELTSSNVVHKLHRAWIGFSHLNRLKQAVVRPYVQQISNFRILSTASPFDRRVTALEWHPTLHNTLAVASKSGDLVLWNYKDAAKFDISKGLGKGGSVAAMTFDLDDPNGMYTASIDGTVCRQCISGKWTQTTYLSTGDVCHWYCCVAASYSHNVLLAGDNFGNLTMMEKKDGTTIWTRRLHKSKISHCEFNAKCDSLLATASVDKTVKLWDLRMMKDRNSALYTLNHERPINSAHFSPDSTRLLTTDQYGELRIYAAPLWDRMERSIAHPHRFFQHLTAIKATWHPIHDVVVVGRYPDNKFPGYHKDEKRSIDVFDVNSGEMICQLVDPVVSGIISLNKFNSTGDTLASGMGYNILIWSDAQKLQEQQNDKFRKSPPESGSDTRGRPSTFPDPPSSHRRRRRRDDDDEDLSVMKRRLKNKLSKR